MNNINKQIILVGVLVLAILLVGAGCFFGRADVTAKQEILATIDQKVEEKIKTGSLPLFISTDEEITKERNFLSGEVLALNAKTDRFVVKVFNDFEGGSFTEFLFQPDYFNKEIIVDQNTRITEIIHQAFPEVFEPEISDPNFELEGGEGFDPFAPEEKEITLAQLREKVNRSIQANQPLHLEIETRQVFVFGRDKSIVASEIFFQTMTGFEFGN